MTSSYPQGPDIPEVEDDAFFATTSAEGESPVTGDSFYTMRHVMVWDQYRSQWVQEAFPQPDPDFLNVDEEEEEQPVEE